MKSATIRVTATLLALFTFTSSAANLKWSGMRNPFKISAEDGVTNLGKKIGKFIELENEQCSEVGERAEGVGVLITEN